MSRWSASATRLTGGIKAMEGQTAGAPAGQQEPHCTRCHRVLH